MANGVTSTNVVNFGSRTFSEIRSDLISLIRESYPEVLSDFTDSSVGAMLIDLNAGVANSLSVNIDRNYQETSLQYAQQRASILNIAKNLGFNIPPKRPSATVVDFTVTIPVLGDKPDPSYYPVLSPGAQVIGGGKTFETQETIDWNSPISNLGDPNRAIVPNLDSNGIIQSYNVTKREVVINGSTSVYKRVINTEDVIPFFTITLPDPDVIEIESIILKEGTNFTTNPPVADFYNDEYRYYEVDYLAQQRIFMEDRSSTNNTSDDGLKAARWFDIQKKFIKEFTPNGFTKITFGSGDPTSTPFEEGLLKQGVTNRQFLKSFLENTALGLKLRANHTLFIRYRTGGGTNSNVGTNVLTSLGAVQLRVQGSRQDFNRSVQRSLSVTNPIPAMGGNDGLSIEQIRNLISYNFSSQNRDVTLTDYLLQVYKMPGTFGSPFRANAYKENNKIVIPILGISADGKLSNTSNSLLMENLTEYLSGYRMINDYIEVKNGKIINLSFDIEVQIENISDNQIANNIITTVKNFMNINDNEMDTNIYLTTLENQISQVNGVINVLDVRVYNKVGGQYSNNVISQEIFNAGTGQINTINNTIYSTKDSMFEIKYPEKDIQVYLRKRTT
ncbi:MAG: hypothetical protein ACOC33_01165 [bacterium]